MRFEQIVRSLRILWRADAIIAQIQLHGLLVRLGWRAFAALIAAFGLLALEIAAYFFLVQHLDAVLAAALLGLANFVLALIIVLASLRVRQSQDMQLALDLHKAAVEALQSDANALQADIASVRNLFNRPLDNALASLAVPAVQLLIKTLRKSKEI
jgi:hypothetical protein